jgi:hypothetical protein
MRRPLGWVVLALLGLAIAAGAAYAASRIATQPIGLSSEPISAGSDLAPTATPGARSRPRPTATPTAAPTRTATAAPTVNGDGDSDDNSGSSGKGRDHDEDD